MTNLLAQAAWAALSQAIEGTWPRTYSPSAPMSRPCFARTISGPSQSRRSAPRPRFVGRGFTPAPMQPHHPTVIPTEASRRFFFAFASREPASLRSGGTSLRSFVLWVVASPPRRCSRTTQLSFRPEQAGAFSSRSLPRMRRLAQWRNLSSLCGSASGTTKESCPRKGASAPEDISPWNSLHP
jgi:hypothetical protein